MSTASIEVMNEAIAIFDGWEFRKGDPNHKCKFCFAGDEPCTPAIDRFVKGVRTVYHYELKYHTSWDWIVPVIKKIKGMHMDILKQAFVMDYMKAAAPMNSGWISLDIEMTHAGVYSFLVWLNSQHKQQP